MPVLARGRAPSVLLIDPRQRAGEAVARRDRSRRVMFSTKTNRWHCVFGVGILAPAHRENYDDRTIAHLRRRHRTRAGDPRGVHTVATLRLGALFGMALFCNFGGHSGHRAGNHVGARGRAEHPLRLERAPVRIALPRFRELTRVRGSAGPHSTIFLTSIWFSHLTWRGPVRRSLAEINAMRPSPSSRGLPSRSKKTSTPSPTGELKISLQLKTTL
jgi:hypothetical protein